MAAIFISYRREDAPDVVGRLHDRIVMRFGPDSVFRDVESIAMGTDFREHLRRALDQCSTLIAVVGPGFLRRSNADGTDYLVEEIAGALERGLRVLPVLVHGAEMPRHDQIPKTIQDFAFRQAARLRGDPDFGGDVEAVLRWLAAGLERAVDGDESNRRALDLGGTGSSSTAGNSLQPIQDSATAPRLRVTLHVAQFVRSGTNCCFINVTNLSDIDVELTHVWMATTPATFPDTPDRPLPKRLRPQESWEVWIPLSRLPVRSAGDDLHHLGRARLSTGVVVSSIANDSVPPSGSVPGGPIETVP